MRTTLNVLAMNSIRLFFFSFFLLLRMVIKITADLTGHFVISRRRWRRRRILEAKVSSAKKKKRQLLKGRSSPLGENSSEAIGISCESVCVLHITFDNNDERLAQNRFLNLFISLRYFAYSLNALRMLV